MKQEIGEIYAHHGMGVLGGAPRRATNDSKAVRDEFCQYFNNEGTVDWQEDNMILE